MQKSPEEYMYECAVKEAFAIVDKIARMNKSVDVDFDGMPIHYRPTLEEATMCLDAMIDDCRLLMDDMTSLELSSD